MPIHETEDDRKNQRRIARAVKDFLSMDLYETKPTSLRAGMKTDVDFIGRKKLIEESRVVPWSPNRVIDNHNHILAFLETKRRYENWGKWPIDETVMIDVAKWDRAIELTQLVQLPLYYAVGSNTSLQIYRHNPMHIKNKLIKKELKGRTVKARYLEKKDWVYLIPISFFEKIADTWCKNSEEK